MEAARATAQPYPWRADFDEAENSEVRLLQSLIAIDPVGKVPVQALPKQTSLSILPTP